MDTNITSEQLNGPHNPEAHHEHSDVSVFGIITFGVVLLVAAIVIYLLIWWLFDYFSERAARADRPLPPLTRATGESTPPEPRLQVSPPADLQALRTAEDALLHNYGWVDRQTGAVRIPVEQAMRLLVQQGLPVQQDENGETGNRRIASQEQSNEHTIRKGR